MTDKAAINERKKEIYFFVNELAIPYAFYIFAYMVNTNFKSKSPFINSMIKIGREDPHTAIELFKNRMYYSMTLWALDCEDCLNDKSKGDMYQNEFLDIYFNKIAEPVMGTNPNKYLSLLKEDKCDNVYMYDKIYFVTNDSFLPTNKLSIDFISRVMRNKKYEFIEFSDLKKANNIYNASVSDPFIAFNILLDEKINLLELFMLDSNYLAADKDKLIVLSGIKNVPLRFLKTNY